MPKTAKNSAPKSKIKTEWDLKKLYYTSEKDPQLAKDVEEIGKLCEAFEKKYKGKAAWLESEQALLKVLEDNERLAEKVASPKPIFYLEYRRYLNGQDKEAEALLNKYMSQIIEYGNKLVFFEVAFKSIPENRQKQYLASAKLAKYRYLLKKLFERNKHVLSEPEEKILNLKSQPARMMWVNSSEKLAQKQTVEWKGKELPLSEARNNIQNLPLKERRALYPKIVSVYKNELADFAEAEMNAVITDKAIGDKLRGYKEPYSATVLHYENDEKTVMNLVKTVSDHYAISNRFYKLKARLMKLPRIEVSDLNVSLDKATKKIEFEEAYETVRRVFNTLDPEFKAILERFAANGQIDAFPKKGKRGGAFCSPAFGQPTLVFLNHVSDFNSLMSLSHEMGHAIHTELSKSQSIVYQDYTISAAEVASTLFESLVFDEVTKNFSDKEKIAALHDRLDDAMATVFRQIACFNFELEMHKTVREKGSMSKEELATLMAKHMRSYLGSAVDVMDDYGYVFTAWPHIRNFFYVYSYAYGELISKALYRKYKADPLYMKEIKKFLSAGGSASPDDIFKSIGIDTRDPKFFEEGLKQIEDDIKRLEKLTAKK